MHEMYPNNIFEGDFATVKQEEDLLETCEDDNSSETMFSFHDYEDDSSITAPVEISTKEEETLTEIEEATPDCSSIVQNGSDMGDDHHFFLSLLPYIKRLNDVEKLKLRAQIQNSVAEALREHELKNSKNNY